MEDIILPLYGELIGERPISHLERIHLGGSRDWSEVSSERATGRKSSRNGVAENARLENYGAQETQGCKLARLGRPWRVGP